MSRLKVDLSEFFVSIEEFLPPEQPREEKLSEPLALTIGIDTVYCDCGSIYEAPNGQFMLRFEAFAPQGFGYRSKGFICLPTENPQLYRHLPLLKLSIDRHVGACLRCADQRLRQDSLFPPTKEDFIATWKRIHQCAIHPEAQEKLDKLLKKDEWNEKKATDEKPFIGQMSYNSLSNLPPGPQAPSDDLEIL